MTWAVHEIETLPPNEAKWVTFVHVIPQFGPEHDLVGDGCWCDPECERMENGNVLVVHRGMN